MHYYDFQNYGKAKIKKIFYILFYLLIFLIDIFTFL